MLTFFTTGKPFMGHNGVIQSNALRSWTLVHPGVEVILFGNDAGAAEAAGELGIRHEPHTQQNEAGSNRVDDMFARARAIARHEILCYSNCDILFMSGFRRAVERVAAARKQFLVVGRRWDTEISQPLNFASTDWQGRLRDLALQANRRRPPDWIDYFVFSRDVFADLPPLVVGRVHWDHWMVWKALQSNVSVVDASQAILAIHQNHDYRHHPQGKQGVWYGKEATANYRIAGGWKHLRTISDATEVLRANRLKPNRARHWAAAARYVRQAGRFALNSFWHPLWFLFLDCTRPLRHALGLRSAAFRRSRGEV